MMISRELLPCRERPVGLTPQCSAAEVLPASLHDMREPGYSRSNTRSGRDRACIETSGQVSRHHNLLPSFLSRRSFCVPRSRGMIEYDHRDQIPAYLLRPSHSAQKFIEGRWPFYVPVCGDRRRADRVNYRLPCILRCICPLMAQNPKCLPVRFIAALGVHERTITGTSRAWLTTTAATGQVVPA